MTDQRAPAKLRDVRLSEISLVDRPANPHAVVTLFKRDGEDDKETHMFQKSQTPRAFCTLDDAVAHLCDVHGMSEVEAMQKAAQRWPSLHAEYNAEGDRIAKAQAADRRRSDEVEVAKSEAFERHVDEVQRRDRCSRLDAMRKLGRERPDIVAKYRSA